MKRKSPKPGQFPFEQIEGAAGASDQSSGGGAGSGNPSAELSMRVGRRVTLGDVDEDKQRLFPEQFGKAATKNQTRRAGKGGHRRHGRRRSGRAGGRRAG